MSGAIVDTLNVAFTAGSVVADTFGIRALLEFNRYGTATVAPLPTQNLKAYYIRRNRRDRNRMVNVFAGNGQLVYTIERKTQFSTVWSVLSTDRREVATVNAGLFNRCFDFHNKPGSSTETCWPRPASPASTASSTLLTVLPTSGRGPRASWSESSTLAEATRKSDNGSPRLV